MLKQLKPTFLISTTFAMLLTSAHAAFDTPGSNSNGWGPWARGDAGTMYAEWDFFENYSSSSFSPGPDSTPDVGSFNTTSSIVSVTAGTPIPLGSGNIYNPTSVLGWSLLMEGAEPAGPTQVALQLASAGNEFDYSNVTLNGMAPTQPRIELSRNPFPGFGGDSVESLFIWDMLGNAGSYLFEFTGAASSVSLTNIAADIGPSPVPLPAAGWLLLSGLVSIGVLGRKKSQQAIAG